VFLPTAGSVVECAAVALLQMEAAQLIRFSAGSLFRQG
jgi:hypothetical protein